MQIDILDNIRIVLVATTHPGNIGAAARAMKTMGVKKLVLVSPKIFPGAEVTARASGADDILSNVQVFEDLQDAIKDCSYVVGTSARTRNIPWPVKSPEQAARQIIQKASKAINVAVIFGRENSGLSNDEIELCNTIIEIPSNPDFSSLNIAAAVQIICYELRKATMVVDEKFEEIIEETPPASAEQMKMFYEHLEQCLVDIDYYDPEKPRLLMRRLKRLFNRAQLDLNEYNIFRGILTAAQNSAKKG